MRTVGRNRRVSGLALLCLALCIGGGARLLDPADAGASVEIRDFSTVPSSTKAGAHPDIDFLFEIKNRQQDPATCSCHDARNVITHLPAGLIGNTHATPQCTIAAFSARQCPVDSQLGVEEAKFSDTYGERGNLGTGSFVAPVFNLVPPPEQPALLGFQAGYVNAPIFIDVDARTESDYGVDATVSNLDHFAPLHFSQTVLWGVPAAHQHDFLRFALGEESAVQIAVSPQLCGPTGIGDPGNPEDAYQLCRQSGRGVAVEGAAAGYLGYPEGIPSSSPEIPFFQNPTTCGETTLETSLDILAYDDGTSHAESSFPATTECAQLTFNPSQSIEPTTTAADSASGAEFRLTVPQFESPSVPSPSELRAAQVTFPKGFTFAPNVTNGKETCSEEQARFGTREAAQCPENSKIGTISVDTPVLPGPLTGAVYLGQPKPGNRFRIFLVFDGFGVHVKLQGAITPDPVSGQIRFSFPDLPETPFESFNMHVFGADRGPLDTPTQCGTYEVTSEWTPWDSALSDQTSRQFFTINEGPNGTPCPSGARPFHPSLKASATASTAGAHTDFWLSLNREDGEQNLAGLDLTTPPGFAATLKGVSYCPNSTIAAAALESRLGAQEQASPSCPASSYVGELVTGSGPGSHPLYLPGRVYLAGPYKGAPLSFVLITPAVSAGYDLGNVVVRAAVHVDPETAQVTTVSDPLPQIFQGIPLRLRQIFVDLNRPGFALNPTNCRPLAVSARVLGDEGATSQSSNNFQVANCAALAFAPKFSIGFTGSTKHAGFPGVRAVLDYPKGGPNANIASTSVTLPPTELIANAHINDPCTKAVFFSTATPGAGCSPKTVIGTARAETPLLEKPLEGPVYLRSNPQGSGLPDIVASLDGQIDIVLDGKVTTVEEKLHGERVSRLRTTFAAVPDAPVSKFDLILDGGRTGLLETSANSLCAHPLHVSAEIKGQNGKSADQSPLLHTPCHKGTHRRAPSSGAQRIGGAR